jgi:peptide/nickel transport system substrate-binding protein
MSNPKARVWGTLVVALLLCVACSRIVDTGVGELHLVLHSDPQGLDPHLHDEVATHWVLDNIYDSLAAFNASMRIEPSLAISWYNPDDLTWRFQLRPGVLFHDGRPLEAADVVASLERARTRPESKTSAYLVEVASVRTVDAQTIEIQTRRPYPILLNKLTFIAIVPRDAPARITMPIGTGPYRFVSYIPGISLELRSFEKSWHPGPRERVVTYGFESDARRRVDALLTHRADVVAELPSQYGDTVAHTPGLVVRAGAALGVTYLQPRVDKPPFADVRVRRAISLAIDRHTLVAAMLQGRGDPVGQLVGQKVFGYAQEIQPPARDLETSRRLLREAGFPNGMDVALEYRSGQNLEPLKAQLAAAGIRLHLQPRPWGELYPRLTRGEVDFYYGTWYCSSGDASDLFDGKIHTRDLARSYGESNSNGYSNPDLDRRLESGAATLSMMERRRVFVAAMHVLDNELPLIPLFVPHNLIGSRRDVQWVPRLDFRIHAEDIHRIVE